jgi:hypothetical protein
MSIVLDGSNGVTFPSTSVQGDAGIGYGQTWQVVTGSRAYGTTYTNSTGKPIQILVANSTYSSYISISINGSTITSGGIGGGNLSTIIPNGSTYNVTVNTGSLSSWAELR